MANENPFLLSLSIMWFRHHNWLARKIRDENKEWNDLRVFLEARIYNIAVFQVSYVLSNSLVLFSRNSLL